MYFFIKKLNITFVTLNFTIMKDRIFALMDYKKFTLGKFADEIGVERSTMSHIKSDRSKPSLDMAQKILDRFPEVNAEWLILGRGSMQKQISDSHEPDLFSQSSLKNSLTEDYAANITTSSVQPTTIKTEPFQPTISSEASVSNKPEKKVVRVTLFYSDNTFEELVK